MADKIKLALDVLKAAKQDIVVILAEEEHTIHRLKIESSLNREMQHLALITGTDFETDKVSANKLQPLTTVAGETVTVAKSGATEEETQPSESAVDTLRKAVEEAYTLFPKSEPKELLKTVQENVLRGVAKKAGVKDWKDAQLNSAFIKVVNVAIADKEAKQKTKVADAEGKVKAAELVLNDAVQSNDTAAIEKATAAHAEALAVLEELKKG